MQSGLLSSVHWLLENGEELSQSNSHIQLVGAKVVILYDLKLNACRETGKIASLH